MTATRSSIQKAAKCVRQIVEAWEEEYGGAEEAVPWNVVRTLIKPIDHICSYRDDAQDDVPQQKENAPHASNEAEILAVRLDRIEKTLSRLNAPTLTEAQHEAPAKSYATVVQQPKSTLAHHHLTPKRRTNAGNPAPEPRKIIVRISDEQEKQRVNELSTKEIVQKVNEGRVDNQVIAARKLPSGEIALYTEDKEARTGLKENTTWAKALSSEAQVKTRTYEVLLKSWVVEETGGEERLAKELEEENKRAIPSLRIVHLRWLKKNPAKGTYGHIVAELDCPETANQVLHRGLVHNMELKSAVRFDRTMQIQQCYKCQGLGHSSRNCKRFWTCGHCAENHKTGSCTRKADKKAARCGVCAGGHKAWSTSCPARENEWKRIREAHERKAHTFNQVVRKDVLKATTPPPLQPLSSPSPLSTPPSQEGEQAEQAIQSQEPDSEPEWTQVKGTQKRRLAQARGRPQGSKNKAKQDTVQSYNIESLLKGSQGNTASQEC